MPSAVTESRVSLPPLRVLVVDDTATNRQILAVFLKKLGHVAAMAEDGAQAVELFAHQSFDLVVMDVMMPVMDGFEATRRIKAMCGERWVPVVFLSALDKDESLVAGLEAGGDDYLVKPINFVIFEAKLRSLGRTLFLQRELEEARRYSQAVTDNLLDAVVTADEQGIIESVNPSASRIFGYAPDEMLGRNVALLMPEPHHGAHDSYLASYIGGREPRIIGTSGRAVDGLRKDGSLVPISLGVSEFRDGGRRKFVGSMRDETAQRAAERKLRENARLLQVYHDEREAENNLAVQILDQLMRRPGLSDPALHYWVSPATNFSGDIVAAARSSDGRRYVLLADATGHGLGAAISVLPVLTLFYDAVEHGMSLAEIFAKINNQLCGTLPTGRFVACAGLCIDATQGCADLWLGGMPAAWLIDAGGHIINEYPSEHLPLGITEFPAQEAVACNIEIPAGGGQFVLMSDGLIEAQDGAGEAFGATRLRATLTAAPPARRIDAVQGAVNAHLDTNEPHDDVTLMLIDLPARTAQ